MQRRPGLPQTSDVLGAGLTAGLGPKVPEAFTNFKEYRLSKDAGTAPAVGGGKPQPWTWSQWVATLLVPIFVVGRGSSFTLSTYTCARDVHLCTCTCSTLKLLTLCSSTHTHTKNLFRGRCSSSNSFES